MKRRSQSLKTLAPNVADFDEAPDLSSLRFEDYDLGNVNEHQRQLRNLVDYEKLKYKPMKVDNKKLEEVRKMTLDSMTPEVRGRSRSALFIARGDPTWRPPTAPLLRWAQEVW